MVMCVLRHSQGVSHQVIVRDSSQTTVSGHHCTSRQIATTYYHPPPTQPTNHPPTYLIYLIHSYSSTHPSIQYSSTFIHSHPPHLFIYPLVNSLHQPIHQTVNLPATIFWKPLIVSSNGTSFPSFPVKTSATWKGCERNRWIFLARATVSLSSSESSSMPRIAMMSCRER